MPTALVLNLPEHGHMNATFPLVAELAARGERVVYLATEPWRGRVEAAGAAFAAYEADAALFDPPAHRGGLYSVMAYLIGVAEQVLPDVLRHIEREKPDYLLIDSMCVWGRLAQQITGLPAVTLGSVFVPNDAHVSMDDMVRQAYGQAPREVLLAGVDALNTYLQISQRIDRRHGTISPSIVEFFANRQRLNVIFTSKYFHLAGDAYDDSYLFVGPSVAPRADAARRHAASAGTTCAFALPEGDQPLIYVSLGTIFNDQLPFFRAAIEALADGPWRVVMSIGNRIDRAAIWPDADRPFPRNIALHEFVPQLDVLANDVALHHARRHEHHQRGALARRAAPRVSAARRSAPRRRARRRTRRRTAAHPARHRAVAPARARHAGARRAVVQTAGGPHRLVIPRGGRRPARGRRNPRVHRGHGARRRGRAARASPELRRGGMQS